MSEMFLIPLITLVFLFVYFLSALNIIPEYERGVIFRLGRLLPEAKGPGVVFAFWPIDRIVRVDLRTVTLDVPPQDIITRDNVTVSVNAVVYFRVLDPRLAIVEAAVLHSGGGNKVPPSPACFGHPHNAIPSWRTRGRNTAKCAYFF